MPCMRSPSFVQYKFASPTKEDTTLTRPLNNVVLSVVALNIFPGQARRHQAKTRQEWARPSKTKQDQARPSKTKQDQARPSKTKQGQARPSKTKQDQARPSKTKQGRARLHQVKTKQDQARPRQTESRQDPNVSQGVTNTKKCWTLQKTKK